MQRNKNIHKKISQRKDIRTTRKKEYKTKDIISEKRKKKIAKKKGKKKMFWKLYGSHISLDFFVYFLMYLLVFPSSFIFTYL